MNEKATGCGSAVREFIKPVLCEDRILGLEKKHGMQCFLKVGILPAARPMEDYWVVELAI